MIQAALRHESISSEPRLYTTFDLSHKEWKVAFGTGPRNPRVVTVPARDLGRLDREITQAKERFGLPENAEVFSCFEAGRDGFWLHRYLETRGIHSLVVDSASIEVSRRKKKKKTDRLDARKLLTMLIRYLGGEREAWSVVRVPSIEDEDQRRIHREILRLQKERTGHSNRINSLLVTQGIVLAVSRALPKQLEQVRLFDGSELGVNLKQELLHQYERWLLVDGQIREIRKEQHRLTKEALQEDFEGTPKLEMVAALMLLCGIGDRSAWPLVHEFFWRHFDNRRQVGSAAGLTGTPYNSGDSDREQGISKAGNKRIRRLMVELAWFWIRYQPESRIAVWFEERFGPGSKRTRRVGIVAVARKLLIALWRYLEFGEVPEGARFKASV
jgi:transposase